MKKITALTAAVLFAANCFSAEAKPAKADTTPIVSVYDDDIRFSESILPYDGGLLISNFGSATMNPAPGENKGYILLRKNGVNQVIVDGLHKPTATLVRFGHLFVCDDTRLIVYDLKNYNIEPQIITFAEDDKVVNALAANGTTLYVSITNTGRIYSLDISDPSRMNEVQPQLWLEIPGPNGLAMGGGVMYIASIPADYSNVTDENVIYRVSDLENPVAEIFYNVPGLYDGVALSDNARTLYFSDWLTSSVKSIDIKTKKVRVVYRENGIGPADIAQARGILYIPDLVTSRIIEINLNH